MKLFNKELVILPILFETKVLNNGYIHLVEYMGGDDAVIRNARRCWRSKSKGENSDRKLVQYLLKKNHKSPFEAIVFTFDIKCPIFVARQWFRHRIGSFQEESLRYCTANRDYYIPEGLDYKQLLDWEFQNEVAFNAYEQFVTRGMKKEVARSLLPLGTYTKFYWTVNGSSLMNFLNLRLNKGAQYEIHQYAEAILKMVKQIAPVCFTEFEKILEVYNE